MRRAAGIVVFFAGIGTAEATYSILGADLITKEVGGSGTSCVGRFSVSVIYGDVPGVGAVHAQAFFHREGRDRAINLLAMGIGPLVIIQDITSPVFDPEAARRQYAVLDVTGEIAAFTGTDTGAWSGHQTGTASSRYPYSIQGNILTSQRVIENALAGFEEAGCDLAERLMRSLEEGSRDNEGDSRCTPQGIPSDGAFIRVSKPSAPLWLNLGVDNTAPMNPISLLREQFNVWRATHPCPPTPPPDAGALSDASKADASKADASKADAAPASDVMQTGPTPPTRTSREKAGCQCSSAP